MIFDLSPFIIGRNDDIFTNVSMNEEDSSNNGDNQDFIPSFTLSLFCSELMKMAVSEFAEEYGIKTKSLGPFLQTIC